MLFCKFGQKSFFFACQWGGMGCKLQSEPQTDIMTRTSILSVIAAVALSPVVVAQAPAPPLVPDGVTVTTRAFINGKEVSPEEAQKLMKSVIVRTLGGDAAPSAPAAPEPPKPARPCCPNPDCTCGPAPKPCECKPDAVCGPQNAPAPSAPAAPEPPKPAKPCCPNPDCTCGPAPKPCECRPDAVCGPQNAPAPTGQPEVAPAPTKDVAVPPPPGVKIIRLCPARPADCAGSACTAKTAGKTKPVACTRVALPKAPACPKCGKPRVAPPRPGVVRPAPGDMPPCGKARPFDKPDVGLMPPCAKRHGQVVRPAVQVRRIQCATPMTPPAAESPKAVRVIINGVEAIVPVKPEGVNITIKPL